MASSQEDATDSEVSSKETPMGSTLGLLPEVGLKIPLSEVDMSLLQSPKTQTVSTQILMKTAKTRTHPTAAINKNRAPQGDVNLERSLEIVRSAVEKSVIKNTTVVVQAVPAPGAAPVSGKEFCTIFCFASTSGLLALSLIYKKCCHTLTTLPIQTCIYTGLKVKTKTKQKNSRRLFSSLFHICFYKIAQKVA
jgi:hypothetical protein